MQTSSTGSGDFTDSSSSQLDLLCLSHLRWHFVTQRPQHLLRHAAKDRRVFYWEEPIFHAPNDAIVSTYGARRMHLELMQEGPTLWVIRPHLVLGMDADAAQRQLLGELMQTFAIERYIRWYYTPMALSFSSHLAGEAIVYDCMDELSGFLGAPPQLIEREQQLFNEADVVFTGGISLYEAKQTQHSNVHPFPSSIDVSHFSQAQSADLEEPTDQAEVPHPRAGFYGVVDERFDIDLLGKIAVLRPEMQFIILGPVVKIDPATLPQAENIHYLGGKTYEQLPAYLAGWDIALLLFARNDATRFISPTKTPEYLAGGKPVISTPIRDVVRGYGDASLIAIAESAEDFAQALDAALLPPTDAWKKAVAVKLAQGSWNRTWASMQREIDRAVDCKRASGASLAASHSAPSSLAPLRVETMLTTRSVTQPRRGKEHFDYLVVGAGFAGSVLAERLASQLGKRVLIIDKRDHIAGNAYDCLNADGILIHKYGPHIFHTNSDDVVAYLAKFTKWRPYEHRVLSQVDGRLVPVPINLDTINRLYNLSLDSKGMEAFLTERVEKAALIRTSEDIVVSRVGRELYEKFFRGYTRKQWGLDPSQLDASVAGRIPVRFDRDDRYFTDSFQAMPAEGFTRMFERMLDHPRITVRTGVDYREAARAYTGAKIVYTGPIDEFFNFRFGPLPYRSLEFQHETHNVETYQAAPVINYPNEHPYTRITEFKYLTGQKHKKTSIVYEHPRAEGDPYYPIPRPENAAIYAKYRELAECTDDVEFCGRLANYKYFNMDQVVAQALATFRRIAEAEATVPFEGSLATLSTVAAPASL